MMNFETREGLEEREVEKNESDDEKYYGCLTDEELLRDYKKIKEELDSEMRGDAVAKERMRIIKKEFFNRGIDDYEN
ncbi:MAG: hypothetical protein V1891_01395 [bacterium]